MLKTELCSLTTKAQKREQARQQKKDKNAIPALLQGLEKNLNKQLRKAAKRGERRLTLFEEYFSEYCKEGLFYTYETRYNEEVIEYLKSFCQKENLKLSVKTEKHNYIITITW